MTKTPKKEQVRTWTWSFRLPRLDGRVMERDKRENERRGRRQTDPGRQEEDIKK